MNRSQHHYLTAGLFYFKKLSLLSLLLVLTQTLFAQFQVQTTVKESRCSANGQITLNVTGGTAPYSYQLVGSVRPIQTTNVFDLLPPAAYQIRITDALGANMVVSATIFGNYQPPTTQCVVDYSNVKLTTTGGRLPYRYAYSRGISGYSSPQQADNFVCLPNGSYSFRVYDSCDNFHTTPCIIDVKDLENAVSCDQLNGKVNIKTSSFSGGIPPIVFTATNNTGDTFRNATGNFSQLTGCIFKLTMSDRCNNFQRGLTCSSLKGYIKCTNFNENTATVAAIGGLPPYQFRCLNNNETNTSGVFTNLPARTDYQFQVKDACGAFYFFDASKMYLSIVQPSRCPFDNVLLLRMNQNAAVLDSCQTCSSFYPYTFTCTDCTPQKTVVDNNAIYQNPLRPFADFSPQSAGTYNIVVRNGCNDTVHITATTKQIPPKLTLGYDCPTNKIKANTDVPGSTYILKDSLNRILSTNTTGIFDAPYRGLYYILATYPLCDTIRDSLVTVSFIGTCYYPMSRTNPVTGQCEFKWKLKALYQTLTTYTLTGGPDSISVSNSTGIFENLEPSSTYFLKTLCNDIKTVTPAAILPNMKTKLTTLCSFQSDLKVSGARDSTLSYGCFGVKYRDLYVLYDSSGHKIGSNNSGFFPAIKLGQTYQIKAQTPEGCTMQTILLETKKYERPDLTASYGVICAAGQTTGNIRAILRGGIPPFNFQITSPPNVVAPIITHEKTVVFPNLPPGNYTIHASDSCGISSDYATSVGPLTVTPQYKRTCDGQLTLEVPFIDSANYVWTNAAGTTVGTNRILILRDTNAQVFTIKITTPQPCSYTNTLAVPRFSPVNIRANAGIDFVSSSPTTTLQAQTLAQGLVGTWRQVTPSAGTTTFSNHNNPTTTITVSDVPGEYLYVWEVRDPISGCVVTDTVAGTFCTSILNLDVSINVTPTNCKKATGKASVSVANTTTPLTYLWSNGKTTPSVDSLAVGIYTVTINTTLSCTPPRVDTIVVKEPTPIPPGTIDSVLCFGANVKVGTKIYTTTGNYKDTLRSVAGCDSIINANLRFSRVPIEGLVPVHQLTAQYCGDSLSLNRKTDTSGLYAWVWQNVGCSTCANPKIVPLSTNTYFVTITDKITKCSAKDSVKVQIEGSFTERIPNAFTPNGDGVNDIFNVIPDPCIKVVRRLRIYNRWGNLVFDKTDLYPQKNEGWQGLDQIDDLASDVYAFIMEIEFLDGTGKKVTGEVSLMR
jgi:gliding motility-associated-like protein